MTDQITTWRALAGEMKLAGENQERVPCVSGVAYFPRFYRAEAAQEVAAALRAACGRIEALEEENELLKGSPEERTPLDDPAWVVAVVEERDRLRARLAEVEAERDAAVVGQVSLRSSAASLACYHCRNGLVHRDSEGDGFECSGQDIMDLPIADPSGALARVRAEAVREADPTGLMGAIRGELDHAYAKHGRDPWGRHEFYAILIEEVEELWAEIKADASQERVLAELRQVAAMCFRYVETGDRYRGGHPAIPTRLATLLPHDPEAR